ncbi:hypothetical protein AOCH_006829 [Aspergillus ochraceoroseus]|nr:hypothetical protein AOCH_006829 [Aspergillus ochraceoroseus]
MASISLPLQPQTMSALSQYFDSADQPPTGHHRRNPTMSAPLPNPPFVFPARDPDEGRDQGPELASSAPLPLPAFSFNPGSVDTAQPTAPSNRQSGHPSGHRRRCSEFIGGEQLVSPGNLNAGQTSDEGLTTPVKLPAPGPGFSAGNRRRHAHRRSAAISSVDLTAITHALETKPYAESAPCTPADAKRGPKTPGESPQPLSYPATSLFRHTPPDSPEIVIDGPSASLQKPTEAPLDSHTLSEALSSQDSGLKDAVEPEIPARKSETILSVATDESPFGSQKPKPRPRTADASLMLDFPGTGMVDDSSPSKRPLSAAGHSRAHKSMSSGILEAALRKSDHADEDRIFPQSLRRSTDDDSDVSMDDTHDASESPTSSKRKLKAKKRQKKVKSWAGAILTRGKGKRHHSKKDTPNAEPTIPPPVLTRTNSDLGSGLDVDFDDDNIVVIRTPTNPTTPELRQTPGENETWASLETSWKPRSFYEQATGSDAFSPVIDLDAALGPFNTPDMRSGQPPESGFSAATRRMYSGGRRGEFVGPEMRYHRRAESAPEMPPFDRSFLGAHRLATTSSLENPDVFYEEEEDAFLAATSDSGKDSVEYLPTEDTTPDSNDVDSESDERKDSSDTIARQSVEDIATPAEHSGLGIQHIGRNQATPIDITSPAPEEQSEDEQETPPAQVEKSTNMLSSRPKTPIDLVKQEDRKNKIPIPPSPDVSPRFLPIDHRPVTSPTELASAIPPFSLPSACSLPNSSFPSPDFTISSEAPRSITTSSTTDPFPHTSMEDVPSLTSSASTMTNTLNRVSATFFSRPRLSTDRSASFSATVPRRASQPSASKRTSLASLSKLMVGPHTERSKLSHEEKPPGDEPETAKKKGHRISRLMHFWRTKDKDRLNENTVEE